MCKPAAGTLITPTVGPTGTQHDRLVNHTNSRESVVWMPNSFLSDSIMFFLTAMPVTQPQVAVMFVRGIPAGPTCNLHLRKRLYVPSKEVSLIPWSQNMAPQPALSLPASSSEASTACITVLHPRMVTFIYLCVACVQLGPFAQRLHTPVFPGKRLLSTQLLSRPERPLPSGGWLPL